MIQKELAWTRAGDDGTAFIRASREQPGWYWLLRPHLRGPGRYDPGMPVASLVHVFLDGRLSSPLADFRSLDSAQWVPQDAEGLRYPSMFAGPVTPGAPSGKLRVLADPHRVEGIVPPVPGWYWSRTNAEAPLLHVDESEVGPIYLDRRDDQVHVWSAATLNGHPVDVGELGFSEPLTSSGGVIDSSGELGRHTVEFFGAIHPPPLPVGAVWPEAHKLSPPLDLSAGRVVLRVTQLDRARGFYEKLGFQLEATRPEAGWVDMVGAGLRLRLATQMDPALHFEGGSEAERALRVLGFQPQGQDLVVTDPDGHRILVSRSVRHTDPSTD